MSASRQIRRALTLAATAALITVTACASVATASSAGTRSAPRTGRDAQGAMTAQRGHTAMNTAANTPGWHVVQTVGPDLRPIFGQLTAVSATSAWSVWSGSIFHSRALDPRRLARRHDAAQGSR